MLGMHRPTNPVYVPSPSSISNQPLSTPIVKVVLDSYDSHNFDRSADALTDWLNGRWKKSGYQVSKETVAFTLRLHGRDARRGRGDRLGGAFFRDVEGY